MAINVINFLVSLAAAMATGADPATPAVTLGGTLWVLDVNESFADATHAVLRPYGGPPPEEMQRIDNLAIQLAASSKIATAATTLAWQLYNALNGTPDANGDVQPRNAWNVPGMLIDPSGAVVADPANNYFVHLLVIQAPPGLVGRDTERGMFQVSFNFNCRFAAVPTS